MDNKEGLIKKHKKFFETPKLFPLKYRYGDQEIEMVQYKILKTNSNWGLLFFPYDLDKDSLYNIYLKMMLMDSYLNVFFEGERRYLDYAKNENAYVIYNNQLLKECNGQLDIVNSILKEINEWEQYTEKIKHLLIEKEEFDKELLKLGYFDDHLLERYNALSGKLLLNMLYQQDKQLEVHYVSKNSNLNLDGKSKFLKEMHKEVVKPQTEFELKRTINKTIKYEKFKKMDEKDLFTFTKNIRVEFIKKFNNKSQFKNAVRNPAAK